VERRPLNPDRALRRRATRLAALIVLALAGPGAAVSAPAADTPPAPPAGRYPLVLGSEWVYATDLPQGDWIVQAFQTARIGAHEEHDHDHGADKGKPAAKPEDPEHLVFIYSVARTDGGQRRPVTLQQEWIRRADDGAILCAHRFIGNTPVFLDPPQTILPPDPAPGKTWAWSGVVSNTATRIDATAEAEETVRVPAGEFKALRVRVVTTSERGAGRAVRWFATGVGLVKEEVEIDVKNGPPVRTRAELKTYRIGPLKPD
jgi:hypothetical protein